MTYPLTGIDASDPTPVIARELKLAQGSSGGVTRARPALILANKVASVGSGSVDGLGDALDTPRLITSRQDVIDRAGYHSEALLMFDVFRRLNTTTDLYMAIVPPGTGSASVAFTFATNSDASGSVKVELLGESITVGVASGDTPTTVAAAVVAEVNNQLHWPVTAGNVAGVVTITAAVAGSRYDYYLTRMRMSMTKPNAMTISKGAVSGGSTDDDQTTALTNLASEEIYYQINTKDITSAANATDNGIGEHFAMITTQALPVNGKAQVAICGCIGTNAEAVAVAESLNNELGFCVHAEANDYSPGMLATEFGAILSLAEVSDKAAKLADYGPGKSGRLMYVPDPYTKTDRPTATEIKAALNSGVTPIAFTATGKPYIVWHVTTRSQTNSIYDYRARPGHLPSVVHDFWDAVEARYLTEKQDRVAADPGEGEKPLRGFSYPRDIKAILKKTIDDKIDGQLSTLDPSQRQTMKDSIDVVLMTGGFSARCEVKAVRHNLKAWFLIEETSPAI